MLIRSRLALLFLVVLLAAALAAVGAGWKWGTTAKNQRLAGWAWDEGSAAYVWVDEEQSAPTPPPADTPAPSETP